MASERRWFRVELRNGAGVRSLGRVSDVTAHPASLVPFASRLVREGATGELVLVDETTGLDVARQDLRHGPRRAPGHGRSADRERRPPR
jgi:hypothetical protein